MGKLPTCCGPDSDTADYLDMSKCRQQVCKKSYVLRNKLATSLLRHCNRILEMTQQHNRHNGLLPAPTCYIPAVDLSFMLRTCYWETGVMNFGLHHVSLMTIYKRPPTTSNHYNVIV